MFKRIQFILPLIFLLMSRCAQVVNLSGGQIDRTPPVLVKANPASGSLSFTASVIVLEFDEYIQVVDAANEVLISPRLQEAPVISVKGKKVLVDLSKQNLNPNTSYRINFGNAIVDMNERNVLRNFEYVFSTGLSIDTLKLKGRVLQAEDNLAAADMLACLYSAKTLSDSLPYIEQPLYICKGDKNGDFQFTHLPEADYELMVIADKNRNLLYDGEKERIGFASGRIHLNKDTNVILKAFKEPPSKTFIQKASSTEYGKALIILNQPGAWQLKALKQSQAKDILLPVSKVPQDTLVVYYRNLQDTLSLLPGAEAKSKDTLHIRLPEARKNLLLEPRVLLPELPPVPKDRAVLSFNRWMDTMATKCSKMKLVMQEDSGTKILPVTGQWMNERNFQLGNNLMANKSYSLSVDTAAFRDQQQSANLPFVSVFRTKSALDFGKLILNIRFQSKQHYVVEIINERQRVVASQPVYLSLSGSNAVSLEFPQLLPGTYQVRIVYDDNQNQKWDSGNLVLRRQPEKISILPKQLKVIADWELEEEFTEK